MTNSEDLARERWRPVEKAVAKRNKLGQELAATNQHLAALKAELPQAEQHDREQFAAALAAGDKAEPARKAMELAAVIAAEERRSQALQTAGAKAENEIHQLREQHRSAWYRDTVGAIARAHRGYKEAINAVAEARDALADEVALGGLGSGRRRRRTSHRRVCRQERPAALVHARPAEARRRR